MLKILPTIKTTQINKAEFVKKKLSEKYQAEDKAGAVNIPYFMRASQEVEDLKANGRLEAKYKELKKGN